MRAIHSESDILIVVVSRFIHYVAPTVKDLHLVVGKKLDAFDEPKVVDAISVR